MGDDPQAGSIWSIWHDPTAYDHMRVGPPYLPGAKQAKTATAISELGALLACLRAASQLHQSNHWRTQGKSFYGDHLLFERVYNESLPFIDQIAERAVGQGASMAVSPLIQAQQILGWCGRFVEGQQISDDAEACVATSLNAERAAVRCIDVVYKQLESKGQLSSGTDNLLQGVADKHEEFVYLLQQRHSTKLGSYDRRPRDWSAD